MAQQEISITSPIIRKPFTKDAIDGIIQFAGQHSLPPHRTPWVLRKILTALSESPGSVYDLFQDSERLAVGVLVTSTLAVNAPIPFELLGIRGSSPKKISLVFETLLDMAEPAVPKHSRGLTLLHHFMHPFEAEVLTNRGYEPYLNSFRLVSVRPEKLIKPLPRGLRFQSVPVDQFDVYFEAFKKVYSTQESFLIPSNSKEELLRDYNARGIVAFLLYSNRRPVGLTALSIDPKDKTVGYINALGVLPPFRKQGLGRLLVDNSVQALIAQKVTHVNLVVSAKKADDLNMFGSMGFQVVDRFAGFIKRPNKPDPWY